MFLVYYEKYPNVYIYLVYYEKYPNSTRLIDDSSKGSEGTYVRSNEQFLE